jgi:hypothetical protein
MLAFLALGQCAMYEQAPDLAIVLWGVALLAIGVLLYRLRLRNRLWYGGFELLVTFVASYFVLLNLYEQATSLTMEIIVSRIIILFAAVYVMIGALDNIGEALPPTGRFTKMCNNLFHN